MTSLPPSSADTKLSRSPFILLLVFLSIGGWRTIVTGNIFYLLNFGYIGCSVFLGSFLFSFLSKQKRDIGRKTSLVMVGGYMLVYLGLLQHENMQIEGFFLYLYSGVFAGATLHYLIAKIIIPFIWGRAWCGWACWTAAVLDFLPWKRPTGRLQRLGLLRYLHFFAVLGTTLWLYYYHDFRFDSDNELTWLILGSIIYYSIAIAMAGLLKDNRAFCKYLCPITVFLKLSMFSISKFEINKNSCIECGKCTQSCPMDIDLLSYSESNKRILSSECIYCFACQNACPTSSIQTTQGLDCNWADQLKKTVKDWLILSTSPNKWGYPIHQTTSCISWWSWRALSPRPLECHSIAV